MFSICDEIKLDWEVAVAEISLKVIDGKAEKQFCAPIKIKLNNIAGLGQLKIVKLPQIAQQRAKVGNKVNAFLFALHLLSDDWNIAWES